MSQQPPSFASTAMNGAVVTGGAQLVKIIIQFLSVILISRLLSPEDFGVVASIMPLVIFVSTFQEIGLQQAVVQRQEIRDDQLNAIFWVLTAVGVVCFAIVVLLGPAAVWFYDDERLWKVAIVAAIPIIINNFNSIHLSLMNRHMRFTALAIIDVLAAIGGFVAALIGALYGLGYWAIMLNPIVMSLISCIGSNIATHWRPSRPSFRLDKDIFRFGVNLTGFNLIIFLGRNLDVLLIGRYVGATALGYYDRAQRLLYFPLQNLNTPLTRVMLPILSKIQHDKERLRSIYLRTAGLLALVSVPGIAAVTFSGEQIIGLLLGEKWLPVAPIFWWLGIAALNLPLTFTEKWLFVAQGKTKELLMIGTFVSIITALSFLIGIQWGVVGVAAAYAISNYLLRIPVSYWAISKIGPVSMADMLSIQIPLLLAAFATGCFVQFYLEKFENLNTFLYIAIAGSFSYFIAILMVLLTKTGRKNLQSTYQMIADKVRSKQKTITTP